MKHFFKKLLSFILCISMIVSISIIFADSQKSSAVATGVQEKIDLIRNIFPTGSYFTSTGGSHNMWDYSVCPEDPNNSPMPYSNCACSLSQITKKASGLYSGAEISSILGFTNWQCCAFATYVFYNIFGCYFGYCNQVDYSNAKTGDAVLFDWKGDGYIDHYAIYLY
ncbi:MAG: hypothetical protein ACI4SJ_01680, partial [Candidatus Avispirillum sp.]